MSNLPTAEDSDRKFDNIIYDLVKSWPDALQLLTHEYLIDHPDLALIAVSTNGLSLRYLPIVFQSDFSIVHTAILNHSDAFQFASKELQENKDILLAKSANNVQSTIDNEPHLITFSRSLKTFYLDVSHYNMLGRRKYHYSVEYIKYFSEESKYFISIFWLICNINYYVIIHAPDKLKNDPNIMLKVVSEYGILLEYGSDEIKDNFNIVLKAIQRPCNQLCVIQFASDRIRSNREIVQAAIKYDPIALKYVPKNLCDDYDIVFAAVSYFGRALEFASERLRDDYNIVFAAVSIYGCALEFASERLRDYQEIVFAAVSTHRGALEFVYEFLRNGISVFKYASDRLRDDIELVMYALTNINKYESYDFLECISLRLRTNHNTILQMISKNPHIIKFIDIKIRTNLNIMLTAIHKSIDTIQYYYPTYWCDYLPIDVPTCNKNLVRHFICKIMTNSMNFKLACGQAGLEYIDILPVDDIESPQKIQKTSHTFSNCLADNFGIFYTIKSFITPNDQLLQLMKELYI